MNSNTFHSTALISFGTLADHFTKGSVNAVLSFSGVWVPEFLSSGQRKLSAATARRERDAHVVCFY